MSRKVIQICICANIQIANLSNYPLPWKFNHATLKVELVVTAVRAPFRWIFRPFFPQTTNRIFPFCTFSGKSHIICSFSFLIFENILSLYYNWKLIEAARCFEHQLLKPLVQCTIIVHMAAKVLLYDDRYKHWSKLDIHYVMTSAQSLEDVSAVSFVSIYWQWTNKCQMPSLAIQNPKSKTVTSCHFCTFTLRNYHFSFVLKV